MPSRSRRPTPALVSPSGWTGTPRRSRKPKSRLKRNARCTCRASCVGRDRSPRFRADASTRAREKRSGPIRSVERLVGQKSQSGRVWGLLDERTVEPERVAGANANANEEDKAPTRAQRARGGHAREEENGPVKAGQGVKDVNRRNALASSSPFSSGVSSRDSPANDRGR